MDAASACAARYAVQELKAYPAPPAGVKDVVTATVMLLGYSSKQAQDYGFCLGVLQSAALSKHMESVGAGTYVSPKSRSQIEALLRAHSYKGIASKSMAAALLLKWNVQVLGMCY